MLNNVCLNNMVMIGSAGKKSYHSNKMPLYMDGECIVQFMLSGHIQLLN